MNKLYLIQKFISNVQQKMTLAKDKLKEKRQSCLMSG
jgi:hypothetical protein